MWCGDRLGGPVIAAVQRPDKLDDAADVLTRAAAEGQVTAAVLYVRHRGTVFARSFGAARSVDDLFLLGSISKPMTAAALMTLYDRGRFRLDDPVRKFLPEFTGAARDRITVRQLLTHVSGLPDQLPENAALRSATPRSRSSSPGPSGPRSCSSRVPGTDTRAWRSCWPPKSPGGSAGPSSPRSSTKPSSGRWR